MEEKRQTNKQQKQIGNKWMSIRLALGSWWNTLSTAEQSLLAPSTFSAHAGCLVSFTVNDRIKSANKYTTMVKDTCRQCYRKSELGGPHLQCNQESEIPEQVEGKQPPIEWSGHLSIWHIIPQDKLHRTLALLYLLMKVLCHLKYYVVYLGPLIKYINEWTFSLLR